MQAVVIHLGLVMVTPAHQGKHLQRLCMLNIAASCLTYWAASIVLTDIAASPSATKQVGDNCGVCFPNYRQYNVGPSDAQLAVARFLMAYHRADFGTADTAVLDERTFVVRGSNAGDSGGAAALTPHADKRRSRAERPNAFVSRLLHSPADELLHVGTASLAGFFAAGFLRASPTLRAATMAAHMSSLIPALLPALLGRPDACVSRFRSFARRVGLSLTVLGSPSPSPGGVLWVSNHYSWLDYPVLQCASPRLLRVVARADMAAEGVFGALAQTVLRKLGVIEYARGDKRSGAAVREALKDALVGAKAPVLLFPEGTSQVFGPPKAFRTGGMGVAFETRVPVQPVCLWYSEKVGLAPETDALAGTALLLRRSTQVVVSFCDLVRPEGFASADEFAAACEGAVRDEHARIATASGEMLAEEEGGDTGGEGGCGAHETQTGGGPDSKKTE